MRASQIGGVKAAARIMNFTRTATEARILKDIRKDDKDLMQAIQDNMFVFDNLIKSDDRSLQTLLRAVDNETLVLALKARTRGCGRRSSAACRRGPRPRCGTRWRPWARCG